MKRHFFPAILLAVVCGCSPNVLQGTVTTIEGEALPGVAVEIVGADKQALTNPRGEYRLRYNAADTLTLAFFKTGYTPGRMDIPASDAGPLKANPVALWPLPTANGVYIYEDFEYIRAKPVEPELYSVEAVGTTYGTIAGSDVGVVNPSPVLLCYKMPKYGAHLYRAEILEGKLSVSESEEDKFTPLVPTREIPIAYTAIDEPDQQLMQIQLLQPLQPGTYMVDFGRVSGGDTRETRIFLFNVEAPVPPAAEGDAPAEPEPEPEPEKPKPAPAPAPEDDSGGF